MSLQHYSNKTNARCTIKEYNRSFPMQYYLEPLLPAGKNVKIADLGAGLVSTIGKLNRWHKIKVVASDILQPEYAEILKKHKCKLVTPIEYQDIENLTYPDNTFDIVHCVNTLDHLRNVKQAIKEITRVCKVGGWIYLRHAPHQKTHYHGHHYWDATTKGFTNGSEQVGIDDFATITDGYYIISTFQKVKEDGINYNTSTERGLLREDYTKYPYGGQRQDRGHSHIGRLHTRSADRHEGQTSNLPSLP